MLQHVATSRARLAPSDGGHGFDGGSFDGTSFDAGFGFDDGAAGPTTTINGGQGADHALLDPIDGALTNGMPQGQCFADIVAGAIKAIDVPSLALGAAFDVARGMPVQAVVADVALTAATSAVQGGIQAAKDSVACQTLDNGHEANALGLAAVRAP